VYCGAAPGARGCERDKERAPRERARERVCRKRGGSGEVERTRRLRQQCCLNHGPPALRMLEATRWAPWQLYTSVTSSASRGCAPCYKGVDARARGPRPLKLLRTRWQRLRFGARRPGCSTPGRCAHVLLGAPGVGCCESVRRRPAMMSKSSGTEPRNRPWALSGPVHAVRQRAPPANAPAGFAAAVSARCRCGSRYALYPMLEAAMPCHVTLGRLQTHNLGRTTTRKRESSVDVKEKTENWRVPFSSIVARKGRGCVGVLGRSRRWCGASTCRSSPIVLARFYDPFGNSSDCKLIFLARTKFCQRQMQINDNAAS